MAQNSTDVEPIVKQPMIIHDVMYILESRSQKDFIEVVQAADQRPGGISARDISLIIEQLARRPFSDYLRCVIKTKSFACAPFRSAITKALAHVCLNRDGEELQRLFIEAVQIQRPYQPSNVVRALRGESSWLGFSLAQVNVMAEWVQNVNCPLPLRWTSTTPNPNRENAAPFVKVVAAMLAKKPYRLWGSDYLFLNHHTRRVPDVWWAFVYRLLTPELQLVLRRYCPNFWPAVQALINETAS